MAVSKTGIREASIEEAVQEEKQFRSIVPKTGFFGDYMHYTDKQESPGSYHFWVGATILSAVLQRQCWIKKGIYNVYPNIFMILVAPSGRCRKSRAMDLGLELIQDFDWLNIMADKTSPEAMLQALQVGTRTLAAQQTGTGGANLNLGVTDATGLIQASELTVFLNRQTYTSGMLTMLTRLYDCPEKFKYLTRNKKPVILDNVAVALIGGSTPDWLVSNLPESAFEGGFMSRIIFMVKFWRDRVISWPSDPLPDEKHNLQLRLLRIHSIARGEMALTHAAREWFTQWYEQIAQDVADDHALSGYVERKPDTVLKLAMLLAASEERTRIELKDLKQGLDIVTWTQERMFKAFQNVELSPLGKIRLKVIEMLEASKDGAISRRDVLRRLGGRLRGGVEELTKVEEIMMESEELEVIRLCPKGAGRPSIIYQVPKKGGSYANK
jgi:hypothetical protein